ncbi:hypothetical protein D9758_017734 [Tetrapyrgos nigripes]|uniref:Uncharacterized protein n=1 Tax=Tetrapyrgos nigripes TaxID=182062 RepID=A0A8H5F9B2_9AGAR|nr:hypothetical protein D9758_017734 [Tetrapyrgos nigripes]
MISSPSDTPRRCLSPGTDTDSTFSVNSAVFNYADPEKGDEPNLHYELPPFVRSLKEGWHTSLQAAAVVSTLFAQTAAQFLGTVKDAYTSPADTPPINSTITDAASQLLSAGPPIPSTASQTALLIVSYGAIIFGYSATISSLFLSERVASLPVLAQFKASDGGKMPQLKSQPISTVMTWCNTGWKFKYLFWHFFISLILGTLCNFLQVFVFICVVESSTSIAIPVAMGIAMMWCLIFFVFVLGQ